MKALRWALPGIAALGFFATFFLEASFEARVTRVQLVRREGGQWATVGTPMEWVDVPPAAVVERGRDGVATLVDADRVKEPVVTGESLRRTAWFARAGCLLAVLVGVIAPGLIERYRVDPKD